MVKCRQKVSLQEKSHIESNKKTSTLCNTAGKDSEPVA